MKIYIFARTYNQARNLIRDDPSFVQQDFFILVDGRAEQHLRGRRMSTSDRLIFLDGFDESALLGLMQVCLMSALPQRVVWRDSRPIEDLAPWLMQVPPLDDRRAVEAWLTS